MEIPRHWRLKKQRYQLIGNVCPHCDAKIFPPRDVCPDKCADRPDHSKQIGNQEEAGLVYQDLTKRSDEVTFSSI